MIEKMKQWLQALEYPLITHYASFDVDMAELLAHRAIESLRQAIADFEKQKPVAWKHYTKPLERRLQHLETKENQNSFDKHEAAALRHVLDIVTQPKREPLTDEDKAILEAVRRELAEGDGNAPGHAHRVVGIWDEDNGDKAGKPCAWCLTWAKFTTLIENESAHGIKE